MSTTSTSGQHLFFTDLRHIQCGALKWLSPTGEELPVGNPAGPCVEATAQAQGIPHGIRLAAQAASKVAGIEGWRGQSRVIHDQGAYRSWHMEVDGCLGLGTGAPSQAKERGTVVICAMESEDGFRWRETHRCAIEVPGQWQFGGQNFFVDPAAAPDARYKFVYCAKPPEPVGRELYAEYAKQPAHHRDPRVNQERCLCLFAAVSPDGLDWRPVEEPLMMHYADTDNTFYYDEALSKYVLYTRMWRNSRRWVGRAESDDFVHWGPISPIIWPRLDDPLDYDVYLNAHTEYPGHAEYRYMFPTFYHRYSERSDIRLYSSEDGMVWSQVPGGPVVARGEAGKWDSEWCVAGKDLVPLGPERIAIPIKGTPYPHKYPRWPELAGAGQVAWACWPEGRIGAVVADREGEFWTFRFAPRGRRLRLNFRSARAGEIRIGVFGVEGRSVEDCDPLYGNSMGQEVSWRGQTDLGAPEGEQICLHVKLRCAELFACETHADA